MSKFSKRVIIPEIIDDFNWSGTDLTTNLEEIEWINKNLGGTSTSANPVFEYIQKNLRKPTKTIDIGCGSGDLLKKIQSNCEGIAQVELIGIDANPNIIEFAKQQHFKEKEISFIQADILLEPQKIPAADIYMLNLFLHHFTTSDIRSILHQLVAKGPNLIVINDLERSRWSYGLFSILCKIKNASFVTFNDGRLSILKGFDRNEMKAMVEDMIGYSYELNWKWAFRWQLVIRKKQ